MTQAEFMAAVYAATTAVEEGKIAEAEVEWRCVEPDDRETLITVTVRKEVRNFSYAPEGE